MNSLDATGHSNAILVRGDVAVIGMACLFPGAPDLDTFWHNIVNKVDAITDVPPERWDPAIFFDPNSDANDRVYSKRGGYLTYPVRFNPSDVGVLPIIAIHGEPEQFLALMVAHQALVDAGYGERSTDRERTQVIIGRGNYLNRGILTMMQHVRGAEDALRMIKSFRPELTEEDLQAIKEEIKTSLPIFNADTAATLIPNLTTGRIANRLDLMGANFTVDAACASSLVAAEIGVRDLLTRKCDLALVGGIYVSTDVGFQSVFCQLHALSRRSQIRPFDKDADGLLLGEGAGCIVLKRLEDAERDGDRIYAVIKGVGTSSDGRALAVLAPRVEGEELALRRAYEMAGISPKTVQLIEAHGTATLVGDLAEVQAMTRVFGHRDGRLPWCGLGSIKSMIGHLMPAAGIAGLIRTALALHHKTLPPTLNCEQPNPRLELEKTPFYINTEARPWIHGSEDTPRRAGVNAFGFGGINAHAVIEEYRNPEEAELPSHLLYWETEVCIFQGDTRQELTEQMRRIQQYLEGAPQVSLKDLAYTLNVELQQPYRVAIVASSVEDLGKKLDGALQRLSEPQRQQIKDREGIYFFEEPLSQDGRLAFLFPGVGAAYVNMLSDLCLHFPEVRSCFDLADQLFVPAQQSSLLPSHLIYPHPDPSPHERSQLQQRLWQEDGALEAVYAADGALCTILTRLGIRPDMMVGHSFGDLFSLLFAASPDAPREVVLDAMMALAQLVHSSAQMYEQLRSEGKIPQNLALLNVGTDSATVSSLFDAIGGPVYIAMDNCPHQVVVIGEKVAVAQLSELLKSKGIFHEALPLIKPAYHTPLFEVARGPLQDYCSQWQLSAHTVEVYSCTTASPYPKDPARILQLGVEHWMRRVEFRKTVEAMYEAGARIFVEVGPGGILTAFVDDILRGRPYLAVASNVLRRSGITQLNHLVAMLASQRIPINLEYLYKRRAPQRLSLDAAADSSTGGPKAPGIVDLALLGTPTLKPPRRLLEERAVQPDASTGTARLATIQPASPVNGGPSFDQGLPSNVVKGSSDIVQAPAPSPRPGNEGDPSDNALHRGAMGNSPSPGVLQDVMQSYLQTMDAFLKTQEGVMQSFISRAWAAVPPSRQSRPLPGQPPDSANTEAHPLPFVGKIISMVPSQEVVTHRQIDLTEDLFLHDHALGGQVSAIDDTLRPLPVIPMTVGMEIMAETAALLVPGKLLIGMKDIQIYQWIDLERGQTILQISAHRRTAGEHEVEVRVHNLGENGAGDAGKGGLALQGIMVFGDAAPEPPLAKLLALTSARPPEFTAEEMYMERLMFHGPRFQGVVSLDAFAAEGLVGQVKVLPTHNLFRSISQPHLLTDFALLDAAGQLAGYWALESVETGKVMFPIRVDALRIYGSHLPPGQRVICQAQMRDVHEKYMRSDIDVIRPDGRLWLRLEGWCDWRFYCPEEAYEFFRFPREAVVSKRVDAPLARLPSPEEFECRMAELDEMFSRDAVAFWLKAWARLVLNHQERREFCGLGGPEQRQVEWLLARIAAKDSIRSFFKKCHGLSVHPADIEFVKDEHGRAEPRGYWMQEIGYMPALSISQSSQLAVAISGRCDAYQRLGVEVQQIEAKSPDFEGVALTSQERLLLDGIGNPIRQEWLARFWCAKEAVGKALGRGLIHGPQSVIIKGFDAASGIVKMVLGDRFAGEFPELAGLPIAVYTTRHRDFVIASTVCERG
jgi:acyl transferase domain-containing protein/phosphopantetheinyl transferase (holo-ACP synthase)